MNIIIIVSFGIISAVLSLVLKQYKPEYSMFISLASGILIFVSVIAAIEPIIGYISELTENAGLSGIYAEILLKSLAVCYLTQLACDCCKDAGETAIAGKLQIAGKIAVLLIALPIFKSITEIVTGLIDT
ncbi:MAG: stage III sporulation protein AC/AD protein family [Ruminiclostridium sp.]|nr:stage III sporulation protein AC/AD protein family [Ruminiclostridium sp.]MDE7280588.1 stage III sporulation protein AC/AD protein family [Ruminiclostridium sp.]